MATLVALPCPALPCPALQAMLRYKQAFARPGAATAAINYYRAMIDAQTRHPIPGMGRALRRPLPMPVLLIWAAADSALGPQLLRGTERYAPDLRLHVLPACSHWAQQDRPQEVNAAMREFLLEGEGGEGAAPAAD